MKSKQTTFFNGKTAKFLIFLIFLFGNSVLVFAQPSNTFIENKGQWPKNILFLTKGEGVNTWITVDGVVFDYYRQDIIRYKTEQEILANPKDAEYVLGPKYGHVISLQNTTNTDKTKAYCDQTHCLTTTYNFFYGNDPNKWISDVKSYSEVSVINAFDGVDIRYYYDKGRFRYDYMVSPGTDVSKIKFTIEGCNKYSVNSKSEIGINTRFGTVAHTGLLTYQGNNDKRKVIKSSFAVDKNGNIGFAVGKYDKTQYLIIDPVTVEWATYIGGTNNDYGLASAVDATGNVIIGGYTNGNNFPTTSGTYDNSFNGGLNDATVSKLSKDGKTMLWSTFLGGTNYDQLYGVAVDADGNVYVCGSTQSSDFPVTSGVVQSTIKGFDDCFITKLNPAGNSLIYSTYWGGSKQDRAQQITITSSGEAVISGFTESLDFPTVNAAQSAYGGGEGSGNAGDIIVAKFNSDATNCVFSTYLGGSGDEASYGVAINSLGNIYISGWAKTYSSLKPYPTTSGAYKTTGNHNDVVVSALNTTGTLLYSTYFGGISQELSYGIAINNTDEVIVGGYTNSTIAQGFPVTSGSYQTAPKGFYDLFVCKFNSNLSTLLKSTYLGGTNNEIHTGITTHPAGYIFIGGRTNSVNYPTKNAYQGSNGGNYDACVTILGPNFDTLAFSSYIGGTGNDFTYGFYTGPDGKVIVTGQYASTGFATTAGTYQTNYGGGTCDIFALKINVSEINLPVNLLSFNAVCNGANIELTWTTSSETNNHYFTIERSEDMKIWEPVSVIQGAGNSNIIQKYSCFDLPNNNNEVYYRLTQTDFDGATETFKPIAVSCGNETTTAQCYPNPFNDNINVYLNNHEESEVIIQLYDLTGRLVKNKLINLTDLGNNIIEMNTSELSEGAYNLLVKSGSFEKFIQVIKTK